MQAKVSEFQTQVKIRFFSAVETPVYIIIIFSHCAISTLLIGAKESVFIA